MKSADGTASVVLIYVQSHHNRLKLGHAVTGVDSRGRCRPGNTGYNRAYKPSTTQWLWEDRKFVICYCLALRGLDGRVLTVKDLHGRDGAANKGVQVEKLIWAVLRQFNILPEDHNSENLPVYLAVGNSGECLTFVFHGLSWLVCYRLPYFSLPCLTS